jgi:DNA-binding transcriptional MerR regulator
MELLKIGDLRAPWPDEPAHPALLRGARAARPASRSQGGFRYYRPGPILNRLDMIRDLQGLGLPLERIRDLMATREVIEQREQFLARVRDALREQDRLLQARITSSKTSARASPRRSASCTSARTACTRPQRQQLLRAVLEDRPGAAARDQRPVLDGARASDADPLPSTTTPRRRSRPRSRRRCSRR